MLCQQNTKLSFHSSGATSIPSAYINFVDGIVFIFVVLTGGAAALPARTVCIPCLFAKYGPDVVWTKVCGDFQQHNFHRCLKCVRKSHLYSFQSIGIHSVPSRIQNPVCSQVDRKSTWNNARVLSVCTNSQTVYRFDNFPTEIIN